MQRQNIAHDHVEADFVRCLRLPGVVFRGYANESANILLVNCGGTFRTLSNI